MQKSLRFGMGIAVVTAGIFIALRVLGGHTESYFVRAAQESAVRCLTGQAVCQHLQGKTVRRERGPLTAASACATANAWKEVRALSNGQAQIVVSCTEGAKTYFYHMGALARPEAGHEQWTLCVGPDCSADSRLFGL